MAGMAASQDRADHPHRRNRGIRLHRSTGAEAPGSGALTRLPARAQGPHRRQAGGVRRAAIGPNQVWQMDFTEYETIQGGTWRISGCADYWAKAELGWHVSMTQNHHDAITAIELAIDEAERLNDCILRELLTDPHTAELKPIAVVSDNGPVFKADGFARFIASRPELITSAPGVRALSKTGSSRLSRESDCSLRS